MVLGGLKCVRKWDKEYLTIGNYYKAEIVTASVVCITGDDGIKHKVPIHLFELDSMSNEVLDIINIVENFRNQDRIRREC